jgi:hypothetical protein
VSARDSKEIPYIKSRKSLLKSLLKWRIPVYKISIQYIVVAQFIGHYVLCPPEAGNYIAIQSLRGDAVIDGYPPLVRAVSILLSANLLCLFPGA